MRQTNLKRQREQAPLPFSNLPTPYKKARKAIPVLPDGAENFNRFRSVFIPTYERWAGTQANPWVIPDSVAVRVLQTIWNAVYLDLPYTVTAGSAVVKQVRFFLLCLGGGQFATDNMVGHPGSLRVAQQFQVCGRPHG